MVFLLPPPPIDPRTHTTAHLNNPNPTENISPLKYWWMKTTKGAINVDGDTLTAQGPKSDRIRRAYTTHVVQSGRYVCQCQSVRVYRYE